MGITSTAEIGITPMWEMGKTTSCQTPAEILGKAESSFPSGITCSAQRGIPREYWWNIINLSYGVKWRKENRRLFEFRACGADSGKGIWKCWLFEGNLEMQIYSEVLGSEKFHFPCSPNPKLLVQPFPQTPSLARSSQQLVSRHGVNTGLLFPRQFSLELGSKSQQRGGCTT